MCMAGAETSLKNPILHSSWGSGSNKLYIIISWSLFKALHTPGRTGALCFFDLSEVSGGVIGFCLRRMAKMNVRIMFALLSDYCLLTATLR